MRSLALCVLIAAGCIPALAQANPDKTAPAEARIQSFTRLVQVPVVVTDGKGNAVPGLTADDFILQEKGTPQKISTFEFVTTSQAPVVREVLAPGLYSNKLVHGNQHRSVMVLVLDAINTPFSDQAYARAQMIKYLHESVRPDSLLSLMIVTPTRIRLIHDFATDPAVLISALEKAKAVPLDRPAAGPMESQVAALVGELQDLSSEPDPSFRNFLGRVSLLSTIHAMRGVAQSVAGIPGRKAIIWITSSFPFPFLDLSANHPEGLQLAELMKELNELNISLYPVDARGLVAPGSAMRIGATAPPQATTSTMARAAAGFGGDLPAYDTAHDSLRYMAEMTGGQAFYNTNDLVNSFRKAAKDASSYYVLGYYLRREAGEKPEWKKIKVKTKRSGLKVRSRSGIFAAPQGLGRATSKDLDFSLAQRSPLNLTGLGIVVDWRPPAGRSGTPSQFHIQVGSQDIAVREEDNTVDIDYAAIVRSPTGELIEQVRETVKGPVPDLDSFRSKPVLYTGELKPIPGRATVRFIVRDNVSGRIGSVVVQYGQP